MAQDCTKMISEMQEVLNEADATIKKQEELLKLITAPPHKVGTVISTVPAQGTVVSTGNELMLVGTPMENIRPGETVTLSVKTGQIIDRLQLNPMGESGEVKLIHPNAVEVEIGGGLFMLQCDNTANIKLGDRVSVDGSRSVITAIIPQNESRFTLDAHVNVEWDEVGGLEDAKLQLQEAVEYPVKYRKQYEFYHKKPTKGILLYGPPGCGKTLLAKALATSLAKLAGQDEAGYIYVKGPEILDKYVGASEQIIRQLFKTARTYGEIKKTRAIIFIDEADAIMRKRGSGRSSDVEMTIVPSFLAEMDGMDDSETAPLILLATNRPDTLDSAITRDGRIDRKVKVDRPNQAAARNIFEIHLRKTPTAVQKDKLISLATEVAFHDRPMYHVTTKASSTPLVFHFRDMLSGAMVAGIVSRAVSSAFRRDIEKNKLSGIQESDVVSAVESAFREHIDMDHRELLLNFTEGQEVTNIKKVVV